MSLKGKTAVITGAAMGIGKGAAVRFARAGAGLALIDLDAKALSGVEEECRGLGADVIAAVHDASDPAAMDAFVSRTVERFGGIDVLVVPHIQRLTKPFLEVEIEEFRRALEVNVTSYYFLTQKVVPHMEARGGGAVIYISSQLGFVGAAKLSAYCLAKGAVVNMTRALAFELAEKNIRVNSVAPGPTDTEGLADTYHANPAMLETRLADVPMGRLGRPEEIAEAILFLASDASSYVTGHNLVADGGFLVH